LQIRGQWRSGKAVVFYEEGLSNAKEIDEMYNISERNSNVMRQSQSSGSEEWIKTGNDRAETITPSHIMVIGTTNY
jgi:hypothetical protein